MEITNFFKLIKKRQVAVVTWVFIFFIAAMAITFIQPLKYRVSSRLLIMPDSSISDPYTIAKSNQYFGSLLSEAVYSGSFFQLLTSSNYDIDWSYFNGDYKDQIKKWKKSVMARTVNDTGVMEVEVYHPDPYQAKQLAFAVNNALITQNSAYQGTSSSLKVKVIDEPTISSYPVKPNIFLNLGAGIIFGFAFGLAYVYYFPTSRKERRLNALNELLR